MRPYGSPAELERRRYLAVARVLSGYTHEEVSEFLGVTVRSVQRWMQVYRAQGPKGLEAKAASGRLPKLTASQERQVLQWFFRSPTEFGFPSELWTGPRVVQLIKRKFHVSFHPRYINQWLAQRRVTPQKPTRQARERNEREIRRWIRKEWPRIKKAPGVGVHTWF